MQISGPSGSHHQILRPHDRKAGGSYVIVTGRVRHISVLEKTLIMEDGTVIGLEDIFAISGFLFEN